MPAESATRARQQGLTGITGRLGVGTRNGPHIRGLAVSRGKDPKTYAEGHRERLRVRYRQGGEAALQDYELLELLLTFAIPRRDTKLLAKKLLERFGTLARGFRIRTA